MLGTSSRLRLYSAIMPSKPADALAIGGDSGEVTLPHYPEYSNRALNVVKTGRTEVYFRLGARLGKCNRDWVLKP